MILAYIRVSTDTQNIEQQKDSVSRYAVEKKLKIDDFIELEISSRKSEAKRGITDLVDRLTKGDTLIVSELSRLGRSTVAVLSLIQLLIDKGVTIIFIKQGLTVSKDSQDATAKVMITLFSLFAEMERDLISQRTKEALHSRKGTGKLGHKEGALLPSKYDKHAFNILELKNLGLSFPKIIKQIREGSSATLKTWFDKRFEKNMFEEYSLLDKVAKEWVINEDGGLVKK